MDQDQKRKRIGMLQMGVFVVLLVAADQLTKIMAARTLKDQKPFVIIEKIFELHYLENRGSAFGMLQGQRLFFVVLALVVVCIIPFVYWRLLDNAQYLYLRIAAILFLSGAVGNAIDRILHGYVIDFFYFVLIDFPIFNVADIYVTVSALGLVGLLLFYYKEEDLPQILPKKK